MRERDEAATRTTSRERTRLRPRARAGLLLVMYVFRHAHYLRFRRNLQYLAVGEAAYLATLGDTSSDSGAPLRVGKPT